MDQKKTKQCKRCKEYKTAEYYRISKEGYWYSYCKLCSNLNGREKHERIKDKRNAQIREYYWKNRDPKLLVKDDQKARGVKNCIVCKEEKSYEEFYKEKLGRISSRCKSCAKIYLKGIRDSKIDSSWIKRYVKKYKLKYPEKYLYVICRKRSKIRKLEFNLDRKDIIIPEFCPVLGIKITNGQNRNSSPAVDRIDNTLGYIKNNVIVVSFKANSLKRDSSFVERQQLVDFYSNIEVNKEKIKTMECMEQNDVKYTYHNIKCDIGRNELRRTQYKDKIIESMLIRARYRAKKRGLEFSLKESDIHLPKYCPIFGIELSVGKDNIETSPSLERIDSTKGYTPDNVIIVSYRANRAKGDATLEELIKINNFYKQFQTN